MKNQKQQQELMESIRQEDIKKIKELLKSPSVHVNDQNEIGCTPLMLAADIGSEKIVSLLLKHKAKTNLVDKFGYTALEIAENNGYHKIARRLERAEYQQICDQKTSQKCAEMMIKKAGAMKPLTKLCLLNTIFKMMTAEDQERTFSVIRGSLSKKDASHLLKVIRKHEIERE